MTERGSESQALRAELLATALRCFREEQRAKRAHEARQRALHVSVARALAGKVSASELAGHFNVTRQRIYQMKDEAEKPRPVQK